MDVKELTYLTAIAEEGSLSGAGKRLHVSQPTLSVFLSGLERTLGVDLFLREKKRLIPTPAGYIYLDAAKQILAVRDQTYQAIRRVTHELTETITVGASPLRGSIMVAQIFPEFSRRFPDVKVEIKESYMQDLWRNVEERRVSFSLASYYDTGASAFDCITTSKEELVLGVPAFHRLASLASGPAGSRLPAIDIREFSDTPFVLLAPGTTVRTMSDFIFSHAGITPTVVFETNNLLVLTNMIRQGAGAGLLPRSSLVEDPERIVYFSPSPRYYLSLGIVVPKGRQLSEAERYLAYLVIKKDRDNPIYTPALNARARSLWEEFHGKEGLP